MKKIFAILLILITNNYAMNTPGRKRAYQSCIDKCPMVITEKLCDHNCKAWNSASNSCVGAPSDSCTWNEFNAKFGKSDSCVRNCHNQYYPQIF